MNLLTVDDLSDEMLLGLFMAADELRHKSMAYLQRRLCRGQVMASLFFEPSLRTRLSFETAMIRLGGRVVSVPNEDSSSCAKGETIADAIAVAAEYADILAVRSARPLVEWGNLSRLGCAVVNAGDGGENHPTQAALDCYTIWRERRQPDTSIPDGLHVGVIGDLRVSRTIKSLVRLLGRFGRNNFYLFDSTGLAGALPAWCDKAWCAAAPLASESELLDILPRLDVLYLNRVQVERHRDSRACLFQLGTEHVRRLSPDAIIMNPGPRREELPPKFDNLPQNRVLDQVQNGLYFRMALLKSLLGRRTNTAVAAK